MSSMDEVMSRHQKMVKAATAMKDLKDPQEILDAAAKLQEMGKELEKAAKKLEAQYAGVSGPEERVILTPDQRERIATGTGVALEMVTVQDDKNATFRRAMPTTDRATIERLAARQAAEITIKKAKEEAVQKLIKALEKLAVPEARAGDRGDPQGPDAQAPLAAAGGGGRRSEGQGGDGAAALV